MIFLQPEMNQRSSFPKQPSVTSSSANLARPVMPELTSSHPWQRRKFAGGDDFNGELLEEDEEEEAGAAERGGRVGRSEEEIEEEARRTFLQMAKEGVAPTQAPCPTPVGHYLLPLPLLQTVTERPQRLKHHRKQQRKQRKQQKQEQQAAEQQHRQQQQKQQFISLHKQSLATPEEENQELLQQPELYNGHLDPERDKQQQQPHNHFATSRKSRKKSAPSSHFAATLLRDLDPKNRFYVSQANAQDQVRTGQAFKRTSTPVWNRALLAREARTQESGSNVGRRGADCEHRDEGRRREAGVAVTLCVKAAKIPPVRFSLWEEEDDDDDDEEEEEEVDVSFELEGKAEEDEEEDESEVDEKGLPRGPGHAIGNSCPGGQDVTFLHHHFPANSPAPRPSNPAAECNDTTLITMDTSSKAGNTARPTAVTRIPFDEESAVQIPERSANYGSARERLPKLSAAGGQGERGGGGGGGGRGGRSVAPFGEGRLDSSEEEDDLDDDHQPVHPFLRMYQTRPGAFARLLSREVRLKGGRVVPGSTIASLMVPHPAIAAERGEVHEEEEDKNLDLQGTTM
jgi:hypothetical protein